MTRRSLVLLAALAIVSTRTANATGQGFTGTYSRMSDKGEITLKLQQSDEDKVTGTISGNGAQMELEGRAQGSRASGAVKINGTPALFFAIQREADGSLELAMMGQDAQGEPDVEKAFKAVFRPKSDGSAGTHGRASTAQSPAPGDPSWKVFRHPYGLAMRYPPDWTMQEAPGGAGYLLYPPGVGPGASEVYLIGGQRAEGIASAEDPRVAATADQMLAQIAPLLHRVGEVEKVKAGSIPGIALTWEGGQGARARSYIAVAKGYAIGLTGIGAKDKVLAREPVLLKIFQSFSTTSGDHDPQVIGVWNRLGTTSIDARDNVGRLEASAVGDHHRAIQLRPDGTCVSRQVDRTIAVGQGVGIDTGDQVTTKSGKWFAGDGKLVLAWDTGEPEGYTYRVSGSPGSRRLVFRLENGKALVWAEAR